MLLIKRKLVMCMYFSYINTIDYSNKLHDCIDLYIPGWLYYKKAQNFFYSNYKQKRQK